MTTDVSNVIYGYFSLFCIWVKSGSDWWGKQKIIFPFSNEQRENLSFKAAWKWLQNEAEMNKKNKMTKIGEKNYKILQNLDFLRPKNQNTSTSWSLCPKKFKCFVCCIFDWIFCVHVVQNLMYFEKKCENH